MSRASSRMTPVPLRGGWARERASNRSDGRKRSSVRSTVLTVGWPIPGWPDSGFTSSCDTLCSTYVDAGPLPSLEMILQGDSIGPGCLVADGAQAADQSAAIADDGLVGQILTP